MIILVIVFPALIITSLPSTLADIVTISSSELEKSGFISSPGYPYSYLSPESTRTFKFSSNDTNERVRISFDYFDLNKSDPNDECGKNNAFLNYKREDQSVFVCGPEKPLPILSEIFSSENRKFVLSYTRRSSRLEEFRGFNATYKFVKNFGIDSGNQTLSYGCEFTYSSEYSKSGEFYSPNYPGNYPKNLDCTYEFHGIEKYLTFNFTGFNLLGSARKCSPVFGGDYLELTQTVDRDQNYFYGRYCGQQEGFNLTVNASSFYIIFKSSSSNYPDSRVNEPRYFIGFHAFYEFTNDTSSSSRRSECLGSSLHLLLAPLSLMTGVYLSLNLTD